MSEARRPLLALDLGEDARSTAGHDPGALMCEGDSCAVPAVRVVPPAEAGSAPS